MEHIVLFRAGGVWHAQTDSPSVRRLFGTDTLPTAYPGTVTGPDVLGLIRALNPAAEVRLSAREQWRAACEFDDIPVDSSFVVFSPENPFGKF